MSAPKFTPGPWTRRGRTLWIETSHGVAVAKVYAWAGRPGDGALPKDANAALIAAAPALYEALENLLSVYESVVREEYDCGGANDLDDYLDRPQVDAARTALAAARGEAQPPRP